MISKFDHLENVLRSIDIDLTKTKNSVLLSRIEDMSKNQENVGNHNNHSDHDNHCQFDRSGGGHGNVCWNEDEVKTLLGADEDQ